MSIEEELTNFRNAWQYELSNSCQTKQAQAKELYLQGVKLEREGYCYEAIEYYRRALQLAPDIEQFIDRAAFDQAETSSNILDFHQDNEETSAESQLNDIWTNRYDTTELRFESVDKCLPDKVRSGQHISVLPNEIISMIFRYVISTELDMRSIENIAGVCKWFYKLARSPRLWQAACKRIWPDLKNEETGSDESSDHLGRFVSWRGMFINRPHLRFDGVYISRIKYYREGEQQRSLCCTLQTVFYHRFLRFFSDGLVLGLNTPIPPQQAVASLKDRASPNKQVMYGQYTINGDVITLALFQRDLTSRSQNQNIKLKPDRSYNVTLKLLNKHSRQSLQWVDYHMINKRDGLVMKNEIDIEPPHFCRFVFGRVKSYTALSLGTI